MKYAAQQENLPMPSTDAWCTFNEQRRATVLTEQRWDAASGVLHVTVEAQDTLPGGTLALPAHYDGRQVAQVLLDGEPMRRDRAQCSGSGECSRGW